MMLHAVGYSRKNPHPHDGRHNFVTRPIHLDIQNCFSPPPLRISKFKDPPPHPPIWISIKLLDTVILLNTQCRRILLGT